MTKPFAPSSWNLGKQIEAAMAKFDAAREQAALREDAREDARIARAWGAEVAARRLRRLYGDA